MKTHQKYNRGCTPRGGAVLLECVLALAFLVIGMVTVYAILDRAQAAARRDALTQEARELAASALALIECGFASPETLIGPSERWRECNDREVWELEIDTVAVTGAQPGTLNVIVRVFAAAAGGDDEARQPTFELGKVIREAPVDDASSIPASRAGGEAR